MTRRAQIVMAALMSLALVQASASQKPAETDDQLRAKAAAASGGDRVRRYTELAAREVEEANTNFNTGDVEKAHAYVKSAVEDATAATDTARTTRKRLKRTEIAIHRLSRRLEDIRRTLALEDQQVVKDAVAKLEKMDRVLIDAMFDLKEKDTE